MPVTLGTRKTEIGLGTGHDATLGVFLGDYMPFVGVRYYAIFDEQDIAQGRARIGPVGWRLSRTSIAVAAPAEVLERSAA